MIALYNAQQVRVIEAHCLKQVPEGELIRRAAHALFHAAVGMLDKMPKPSIVLALIGPGNNGADARLCGELLAHESIEVQVFTLKRLETMAEAPLEFSEFMALLDEHCLLLDGLFGIGLNRAVSANLVRLFEAMNRRPCKVIAVDIPSGLNASTGQAYGAALRADLTVTMLVDKSGLHTGEAAAYVGLTQVEPLDIQLDQENDFKLPAAQLLTQAWLKSQIPYRSRLAHKGSQGSVLIVGGASGMRGAALLAALGAQASGAGKVFLHFLDADPAQTFALSMMHPSLLLFNLSGAWDNKLKEIDALVIGCGLGQSNGALKLLLDVLTACKALKKPIVLDADALNLIAQNDSTFVAFRETSLDQIASGVMTPHPLEAARLLALPTSQVQADRFKATQALADKYRLVAALKGPGTVIACPKDAPVSKDLSTTSIAPPGSPALAVGGTGDVLAGIIGSLLAQGFDPYQSAQMGTTIHALAGSQWSETRAKSYGLKAEELAPHIVKIMNVL